MCVARIGEWAESLRLALRRVHDPTERQPVPWLLAGDAALALQGVNVEPQVLDFRAASPVAAAYFAQLMRPYELPDTVATVIYRRGGNMMPSEGWRSNCHQRIVAWSHAGKATWLGRWNVGMMTVQVSHVLSIHSDPVALAAKDLAKGRARRMPFEKTGVAVVPIEYLLAESGLRNDVHATHRILHVMRQCGYDPAELETALRVLPSEKAYRLARLAEFSLIAG
jgi:hypothetical protein